VIVLKKAIEEYLLWMIDAGYGQIPWQNHQAMLYLFADFVDHQGIAFESAFTFQTMQDFQKLQGSIHAVPAVRGLSRYLYEKGQIDSPIQKPLPPLPQIYEQYLKFFNQSKQVHPLNLRHGRVTMIALNKYLQAHKIILNNITIEDIDQFMQEYTQKYQPATRQKIRSRIKDFLRYLYLEQGILKRDLAPFIVGAPIFARSKPPRFLYPEQIQRLFNEQIPSSPQEIRAYAMLHLAFYLGLRPKEISLLTLDDIFFQRKEIRIPYRKNTNTTVFPLPGNAIQAISAYIINVRIKTNGRRIFYKVIPPYKAISPAVVAMDIKSWFNKVGIVGSAYSLRHTYAQNLLQAGASIFEIKEMMGHDIIKTSKNYLHIHTRLMREVLFDE
jgi:site-specific recombinase XerD